MGFTFVLKVGCFGNVANVIFGIVMIGTLAKIVGRRGVEIDVTEGAPFLQRFFKKILCVSAPLCLFNPVFPRLLGVFLLFYFMMLLKMKVVL